MTKRNPGPIRLACGYGHNGPFILSHLGLPDLLPDGTDYTPEQADEVRTLALINDVPVIEKGN